jgi:hypothetical protein
MEKLDTIWLMLFLVGSAAIVTLAFATGDIFALY